MNKSLILIFIIVFQTYLYSQRITDNSPKEIIKSSELIEINDSIYTFENVQIVPSFSDCKSKKKELTIKKTKTKIGKLAVSKYAEIGKAENLGSGIYRIIAKFIIDKEGNVINIQVMFPNEKIRDEAFRKLSEFPKFESGKTNDENVYVEYNLQIPFIIN